MVLAGKKELHLRMFTSHFVCVCCVLPFSLLDEKAPITEELVFRACVLAVYYLAGLGRNKMLFLTPLTFGLGSLLFIFLVHLLFLLLQ